MATPVLHVLAGSNGAGKSTYAEDVLCRFTHLPFVNADLLAAERWGADAEAHAYEASRLTAERRTELIATGTSFVTETVFSHPSKLDLLREARDAGYLTHLHVLLVPEELSVRRVGLRVVSGGHSVPEEKIRGRYARLWALVADACRLADRATVYDNSSARTPFRVVATYDGGRSVREPDWPHWTPAALRA